MREAEVLNNRAALRAISFQSDLARDKSILNFAFTIFMGLLATFNLIKDKPAAIICAVLAMLFCLISVFLSLKVLKNNRELIEATLSEETEPKDSFKDLLVQFGDRCAGDSTWAYRFFWAAVICLVLCVVLYSGIAITFANH